MSIIKLNRSHILSMQPGVSLDALVGEKVMGQKREKRQIPCPDGEHGCAVAHYCYFPPFSTVIGAAWEVLTEPKIMDRYQIGVYPTSFGKWIARPFMPGGKDCTVQADTAQEAICKSALLAVMGL